MNLSFGKYFFLYTLEELSDRMNRKNSHCYLIDLFVLVRDRNTIIYVTRNQLIDPINDY